VVLVLSASLLTRSALQVARPDPRFRLTDKLVVQIDPLCTAHDPAQSIQACEPLVDHLASLPGIEALGTSPNLFYGGGGYIAIREHQPGKDQGGSRGPLIRNCEKIGVDRNYFAAMDLPLLQGRPFDRRDHAPDAEKVAIIDESLARKLRPDGQVLDHFIQWSVPAFGEIIPDPFRVVGVVPNRPGIRDPEPPHQMYTPTAPDALPRYLYIHAADEASIDLLRRQIVDEVHRVAPAIPVLSVATLAEIRQENSTVWLARFGAHLALVAGVTALFLATLGIYAIKGYMVASRTSEIGIRMALGATHGSVIAMVLREGLILTLVGLIVGLGMGLGVAKLAASLLYDISPIDPVSIVVTLTLLGLAALLASCIPARRAARIDPMEALRYE